MIAINLAIWLTSVRHVHSAGETQSMKKPSLGWKRVSILGATCDPMTPPSRSSLCSSAVRSARIAVDCGYDTESQGGHLVEAPGIGIAPADRAHRLRHHHREPLSAWAVAENARGRLTQVRRSGRYITISDTPRPQTTPLLQVWSDRPELSSWTLVKS